MLQNKESWERLTASKNKREWAEKARLAMLEDEEKVGREDKNGLMSDTMPLCVGAPYDDKLEHSARHTGRSFVSGGPKRGINGLFSVPPSLAIVSAAAQGWAPRCCSRDSHDAAAQGDTYRDVTERARERRLKEIEINKKFGERRSFRPTGRGSRPLDDPTARGFLGEVSKETSKEEIQRRLKEEREKKAEVKRDVEVGPRNFTTNPTKKGTFGYTGTLLGHKTEQGKELLSYKPDPESDDAARRRKELEDSKAAVGDRPRFVSRVRVRPEGTFTPHQVVYEGGGLGPGGGATVTFRGSPSKSRKRPSSAPPTQRHVDENDDRHWHPPHAPKSGFFGSFERYPEHVPDPIPEAVYHSRDEEAKVWRPNRSGRPPSAVGPVLFSRRNVARGMRRLSAGGSAHDAARALLRVRKVQSAGRVRGGRR